MRWAIGLFVGFLTVLAVNGFMLYKALQNPPMVEASYQTEPR